MGNAIEPGLEVDRTVVCDQGVVRAHEGLLDRVLRALSRQHSLAVAQERPPVALDERLEGPFLTGARQVDQASIGLGPEQRSSS